MSNDNFVPSADEFALVTSIDQARKAWMGRKKRLTESERQLLLAEVAKISAELGELQAWAAAITRRVTDHADERTGRTA
ncbi:hypothetical protein [Actinoallomurus iriomotensis]|nr:hypothetical protein [Actinoallomurus iriomotensis]